MTHQATSIEVSGLLTYKVAVLLPCYNEGSTIGVVVKAFIEALPHARVYVYDNNSTDNTSAEASAAGAIVRREPRQGKGHVVRRMFADIDADIYVMADGDNTYDASAAPALIQALVANQLDIVNGARVAPEALAYRLGHRTGNVILSGIVRCIFGRQFRDMLSGYKVFSRRFVKSFPLMSKGFEIETEFTVHALELGMSCAELQTVYDVRPEGSESKLRTIPDGIKILMLIARLIKDEKPFAFFATLALVALLIGMATGIPVIFEFLDTRTITRLPSAVLSAGIIVISALLFTTALILDMVTKTRREIKRLAYLSAGTRLWL